MRLTQIKLAGFKSFVDPTLIQLPGQLVGIVGPNGCGKSNLIDAVRWVLGESKATALRGESMQDVIFNGSGQRQPVARASVELVFDNSLGRASGQWSQYSELSVKRILARNGDSSYYINNAHVRRRDITDMFLGTGLGPRAYGIIEQGMISRIIEAKPEEIRVFLEEAAGVSKYRERRRETENRLEDTRENLARVEDIRQELAVQLEKLEVQAQVAAQFQQAQTELRIKQHHLWALRRADAGGEADRILRDIDRANTDLEAEASRQTDTDLHLTRARVEQDRLTGVLSAAQAAYYAASAEVSQWESELKHLRETQARLDQQQQEAERQAVSWEQRVAQLAADILQRQVEQAHAEEQLRERDEKLALVYDAHPKVEDALRMATAHWESLRQEFARADQSWQLEDAHYAHSVKTLQALSARRDRLLGELRGMDWPDAQGLLDAHDAIEVAQDQKSTAEERLARGEQAVAQAELQRNDLAVQLALANESITHTEARRKALVDLQAAVERNERLDPWLSRLQLDGLPRLWQALRVVASWETAVEAVLRERLHSLLCAPERYAELLSDPPPERLVVLFGNDFQTLSSGSLLADMPSLESVVVCEDPALRPVLSAWLSGVHVCEDLASGLAKRSELPAGAMLVTATGHLLTRDAIEFHAPGTERHGMLARRVEIEELGLETERLQAVQTQRRLAVDAALHQLREAQAELGRNRVDLGVAQTRLHDARLAAQSLQHAQERFLARSNQIESELAEIAQSEQAEQLERQAAHERRVEWEDRIEELRESVTLAEQERIVSDQRMSAQRSALAAAERETQEARFALRQCVERLAELARSRDAAIEQQAQARERLGRILSEREEYDESTVVRELNQAVERRLGCETALSDARNAVESAAADVRRLDGDRLAAEQRLQPLRARIAEMRMREQAARITQQQFELQLSEAGASADELALLLEQKVRPSVLQVEIARLNEAIAALGNVNLAALDELQASRERNTFLDTQSADLNTAIATLEDAIRRIDRETRVLLRDTYDRANHNFGELFPILFGGGEAKLIMTGEEILDAGIQVMAHPPGKKNSSIHLLSGGEKALTAIALVFALFQLNPAPFCLLDEVDAPLDDSNTERFCSLVRKMSVQTQFMFISHNKITMELANQLVGVTMQESGVSRVVAVDIDQAVRMRDAA